MLHRDLHTTWARQMRRNPADAEHRLWQALRMAQLGVKFRRQMPMGRYIVDFACISHRLIVEADGGQHAGNAYDNDRGHWLRNRGYTVIRFHNRQLLTELAAVLGAIEQALAGVAKAPLL